MAIIYDTAFDFAIGLVETLKFGSKKNFGFYSINSVSLEHALNVDMCKQTFPFVL